jgi:large subunit ribosomal protein L3
MRGLIARKVGMTQIFTPDGKKYPVTVLQAGPNVVVQKKSAQGRDGYTAVKLGFEPAHKFEKEGEEPTWRMNKPLQGIFKKAGLDTPLKHLTEIRLTDESELDHYEVGASIGADEFQAGQFVDVTGTSKGRGFAGVMKRHNFHGAGTVSHGTHEYFRHAGSIGASADPARVVKGKRMPGRYGGARSTVQNLHVVDVLAEENLLLVKGGVPGPNGGLVVVRTAIKRPKDNKNTEMTVVEEG